MGTPFKMKGSPFQRNFGIVSPLREDGSSFYTGTKPPKKEEDYIYGGILPEVTVDGSKAPLRPGEGKREKREDSN
jgi:hypothetical protein